VSFMRTRLRRGIARLVLTVLPDPWIDAGLGLRFRNEFRRFQAAAGEHPRLQVRWEHRRPCLRDYAGLSAFDRHYFFHLAWAARVLAETKPAYHVDISSHVDFCAVLSAFIPTRFYEYHPLSARLENLQTGQADLLKLPFEDDSVPSLTCLHVVEHVGLGRYGDPLDVDGDLKAMVELKRVLAPGGQLLLAVPVGRPRVEFNAHRVYSYGHLTDALDGLTLKEFALIPDSPETGDLVRNASPALADQQEYGCGCFWTTK